MGLVQEISRRHLPRIVVIYLGSAWVCIEAVNFFVEKYGLGEGVFQAALNVALGAIPAVLIYAWYHGEPGRQRVTSREIVLYSVNVIMVFFLLWKGLHYQPDRSRQVDEELSKSIAVLPFENLSGDPEQEYITDGITEDIISKISQISGFKVISRTSSFHYKHSDKTLTEIGRELRVGNILEGSTRRSGDVMRISVKLVNALTDESLWAETFDRDVTETFKVQSEVASRIASALQLRLTRDEEQRLKDAGDFNLQAYEYYQRAMNELRKEGAEDDLKNALLYFKLSLQADSSFYLSWVGIAQTYLDLTFWGRASAASVVPKAKEAIQQALELNNRSGRVYQVLASIALHFEYDSGAAERYLKKAMELEPGYANTYYQLAEYRLLMDNEQASLEAIDKAIELDPLYVRYTWWKAESELYFGKPDVALAILDEILKENPGDNFALWTKGLIYMIAGKYDDAIKAFRQRTVASETNWMLGLTYGLAGSHEQAMKIFEYQLEKSKLQYVPPAILGFGYYSIGHYNEAYDLLEEQIIGRDGGLEWCMFVLLIPLPALDDDKRLQSLREQFHFAYKTSGK